MSGKLSYERYYWFHNLVRNNKYPNARHLAEKFEISHKTAQRDIEFMRDRVGAPIEYSHINKGYFYTDEGYELPPIWLNEKEIIAFILAKRLATAIPDRNLKDSLNSFIKKFSTKISEKIGFDPDDIQDKISLKNIEYYYVNEDIFIKVVAALFAGKTIEIQYYSPYKDEETRRNVYPLHLLDYMGNWHLIAFCALRNKLRNFALSRIKECKYTGKNISLPDDLPNIKDYIRKDFGIFSGKDNFKVSLRFSPEVANRIKEQIWHKKQKIKEHKDGSVILEVPVSGIPEIKREILKYGADVKVLKPMRLKKEIMEEIKKMGNIYQ